MSLSRNFRPSALVLAGVLAATGLAGCKPGQQAANMSTSADSMLADDALPLTDAPQSAIAPAPAVATLPAAPRPKVVYVNRPAEQYQYVDDAYAMNDAFGDAPPDYGFDYGGTRPWAWIAADNAMRLVEPISGGNRYYYYRPGAAEPYLVRDNDYAYAYSGDRLVTVYDSRGRALDERQAEARADYAGRYLARARALEAAARQHHREQVNAANWAARQQQIDNERRQWADAQRRDAAWNAWHARHEAEQRQEWQAEQARRDREASDFHRWRDSGYQGQAPQRVSWQHRQDAAVAQARQQQAREDQMRQQHDQQVREDQQRQQQARIDQARQDQMKHDRMQQDRQRQEQARAEQQRQAKQQARVEQARKDQAKQDHQRQAKQQAEAKRQEQVKAQARHDQAMADARAKHAADVKAQQQARDKAKAEEHAKVLAQAQAREQHNKDVALAAARIRAARAHAGVSVEAGYQPGDHNRRRHGHDKKGG